MAAILVEGDRRHIKPTSVSSRGPHRRNSSFESESLGSSVDHHCHRLQLQPSSYCHKG